MWITVTLGILILGAVAYFIKIGRKLEDSDDARNTVEKMAAIQKETAKIDEETQDQLDERAWERRQGNSGSGNNSDDSIANVFPSLSDRE